MSFPNVSANEAKILPRHRWYFFKEAFSPAVVDFVIESSGLAKGSVVVDPFSGSGTTPISAMQNSMNGFGIEVNPFLQFVARTKGLQTGIASFDSAVETTLRGTTSKESMDLEYFSTFSERAELGQKRGKWLFNSSVLRAFGGGWAETKSYGEPEQKLIQLCLLNAAMDSANAVKDGKCLRYKKDWQNQNFDQSSFANAFKERCAIVREDLESFPIPDKAPVIYSGDSREKRFESEFDLCVTSPPYLNSFDYTDVYRPELFLGGFIKNMGELRALRLNTLRSHIQTKWKVPNKQEFGPHYSETLDELKKRIDSLWNTRIPQMVQAYFEDMATVLLLLRSRAKRNASLSLVVSTSAYGGVEIPVDLIIADIGERNGWFLREVVVLRHLKRVSFQQWHDLNERESQQGPYLRESMIVFDAIPK